MKKIIKLLVIVICMITLTTFSLGSDVNNFCNETDVKPMGRDIPHDIALLEILENQEFEIFILGSNNYNFIKDMGYKYIDNIDLAQTDKKFKSIWINLHENIELLNNKKALDILLDQGYSLNFLGMDDYNILREKFGILGREEVDIEDDYDDNTTQIELKSVILTKNNIGEYLVGYVHGSTLDEICDIEDLLLSVTWNRRNDKIYTTKQRNENSIELLDKKLQSAGSSPEWSTTGWTVRFSETPYYWPTQYGNYNEWKGGYYLARGGNHYYALTLDGEMAPRQNYGWTSWSRRLRYRSEIKRYSSYTHLREHGPKGNLPSNNTWSFEIGVDSTGPKIGASWDITRSDLKFFERTDASISLDKEFEYQPGVFGVPDYLKYTSYQATSFIVMNNVDSSVQIHNRRNGEFIHQYSWGGAWNPSTFSHSYRTTLRRP